MLIRDISVNCLLTISHQTKSIFYRLFSPESRFLALGSSLNQVLDTFFASFFQKPSKNTRTDPLSYKINNCPLLTDFRLPIDFSTSPSTALRVTVRNDKEPHWCQFVKLVSTAYWLFPIKPSLFSMVFTLLSLDFWLLVSHWTRFSIHFLPLFFKNRQKTLELTRYLTKSTTAHCPLLTDFRLRIDFSTALEMTSYLATRNPKPITRNSQLRTSNC